MTFADLPLCVDVDGTLVKTDLLYESCVRYVKERPLQSLLLPFLALRGRSALKRHLASTTSITIENLPYRDSVLSFVRSERERGRQVFLASASDELLVSRISSFIGLESKVFASNGARNLKSSEKARVLAAEFGEKGFAYMGDSFVDLPVFERAGAGYLCSNSPSLAAAAKKLCPIEGIFPPENLGWRPLVKALRPHQWAKNLLIFIPLVLAHRLTDPAGWAAVISAFVVFSACASAVYLLNDMLDVESDRRHPTKRFRPCASGSLPIPIAAATAAILVLAAFSGGRLLPPGFLMILTLYFLTTCAYSTVLKSLVLVDIMALAVLYTLRVLAGGYAAEVVVSQWLLALSMFLFFSLACVKRYSELVQLRQRNEMIAAGRAYRVDDLERIGMFGVSSGYLTVLVLALYTNSEDVTALYNRPVLIWLACPLLAYWISRIWLLAGRGLMHEDPLVFALRDRTTYIVGFIGLCVFAAAL